MEDPGRALSSFRAAGATHVLVISCDYAVANRECRALDGTVYPIEHARRERPLPLSPTCNCRYVPLVVKGLGPTHRHVLLTSPLRPVREETDAPR